MNAGMTTPTFVRKAIVCSRGACSPRPDRAAASDVEVTTVRPATSANAASRCPKRSQFQSLGRMAASISPLPA